MNFFTRKFYQVYLEWLKAFSSDDAEVSKVQYFLKTGKELNLDNPKTFAEKMQWLKLYYYDESFGKFADKYQCRQEVKDRVGEDVLVKLLAVYDSVDAVEFEKLPEKFALKCSHGSGFNLIVHDKSRLNIVKEKSRLEKYMTENYYYKFREKIYKDLMPTIVVEELLEQPESCELIDYKFQCFDGVPANVLIKAKEDGVCKMAIYDLNWNKLEGDTSCKKYFQGELPKPDNFEEMKEVAAKLSKGFPFLRVDLYSINGRVYFGEMTFIPNGGAKDPLISRLNHIYGDLIRIPANVACFVLGFILFCKRLIYVLESY